MGRDWAAEAMARRMLATLMLRGTFIAWNCTVRAYTWCMRLLGAQPMIALMSATDVPFSSMMSTGAERRVCTLYVVSTWRRHTACAATYSPWLW